MTDDQILAALLRRFLASEYWNTGRIADGSMKLCIDGTIYDLTDDELAALDRAFPAQT